ncbi:MAG: tetratricopeptide repeat protein [Caldilineaceae bacterium]|nr:tetratricopeptide repeat protein [Caldilineaceae bacterium]MCB0122597.1 tetratricopeptide repeat protein [Caldilineaceae bacterium]
MISRVELRQPFMFLGGLLMAIAVMSYVFGTNPSVNLWSVRYLWATTDVTSTTGRFSALSASLPAQHSNGLIWQARAALSHGEPLRAAQQLATVLATNTYDAWRLQAEIFYTQREYAQAFQLWYQLAEVNSLLIAGHDAMQRGDLRSAQLAYEYAYQLDSQQTVRPLAQLLWREQGEADKALQLLHQHAVRYPTSRYYFDWLSEMGAIYTAEGKVAEAVSLYRQLLTIAPDRYQDWIALGWLYAEERKDMEMALAQFDRAIAANPAKGEGYFAKAELLEQQKLYPEAELLYTSAIERAPERVWWYLARASAVQKEGDLSKAVAYYSDARQRFPESMQAHFQAAWAYKLLGDNTNAIAAIEDALRLNQQDQNVSQLTKINTLNRAGQIYEATGRIHQAVRAYQQVLQLSASNLEALEGLARLQ